MFQCFGVFRYFYEPPEKEESLGPHVGIRFRDGEEDMKTPESVADKWPLPDQTLDLIWDQRTQQVGDHFKLLAL